MTCLIFLRPNPDVFIVLAGVFRVEVWKSFGAFLIVPHLSQHPSINVAHKHLT